jgi:2-methylcitrate dehydratase PrpD
VVSESSASTELMAQAGQFRYGAWDPVVLRRTELCLLDSLGCFSAGLSLKHCAPSLAGARGLLGPFAMAYVYGQAANALDYDDTLFGHPGAPIVGTAISVGAREGLSVDRLLRGIAAGYEAHTMLGAASVPSPHQAAHVRSVGVWDTVAASIGIGVALDLDDAMLERIIGVAVSHSLLPYTAKWYERPVPAVKNNFGWAAAGAVLSVDLAVAGQTGVTRALDGDAGMWRMSGSDRWDIEQARGQKPAVLRTGFKHFPACWHLQEYLKTFSALLASIAPDDEPAEIVLAGPEEVEKFCERALLGTADVAFSLPATVSLLICAIEPGPQWDCVDDRSAAVRYRDVFRYERADDRAITIRTGDGSELTAAVDVSDPADPAAWGLDEQGVLAKHERLADPALRMEAAAALAVAGVPDRLYDVISQMVADRESASP